MPAPPTPPRRAVVDATTLHVTVGPFAAGDLLANVMRTCADPDPRRPAHTARSACQPRRPRRGARSRTWYSHALVLIRGGPLTRPDPRAGLRQPRRSARRIPTDSQLRRLQRGPLEVVSPPPRSQGLHPAEPVGTSPRIRANKLRAGSHGRSNVHTVPCPPTAPWCALAKAILTGADPGAPRQLPGGSGPRSGAGARGRRGDRTRGLSSHDHCVRRADHSPRCSSSRGLMTPADRLLMLLPEVSCRSCS
jgi:hypothetical protein